MGFFNRKHKRNSHIVQEIVDTSQEEDLRGAGDSSHKKDYNLQSGIQSLTADVEKLKAQSEANNELRQLFSEKFSRLDEEIGELRSMLVDREKDMQTLEVTAAKASELVSEVQPEKLMIEVKKQEVKLESLKGKIESHEQINETIMEELRGIRNSIRAFRGVKEIEKMTKDLLEEQAIVKKIEGRIEHHSDKVESMFLEINKKYEKFRLFKEQADSLNDMFSRSMSEFEDFKIKFSNLASKEEFEKFQDEIKSVTGPLKKDEEKFERMLKEFRNLERETLPLIKKYKGLDEEQNEARKRSEEHTSELQSH